MSSQGLGFFTTPDGGDTADSIKRRLAYAKMLQEQGAQPMQGAYGGLASAGKQIAAALIGRGAEGSEKANYAFLLANTMGSKDINPVNVSPEQVQVGNDGTVTPTPTAPDTTPIESYNGPLAKGLGQNKAALLGNLLQGVGPEQGTAMLQNAAMQEADHQQMRSDKMEDRALDRKDKTVRQLSPQEAVQHGYPANAPVFSDAFGNITSEAKPQGVVQQNQDIMAHQPITPYQQAEIANQKATTGLGYAQLNKPQFVPFGASGYMQGGKYVPLPAEAGGGGSDSTFGKGDPNAPTINGQLGISTAAYNLLTGNTASVARGRPMQMASQELDQMIQRRGLDLSVVKPRVQAYNDAVKMNTLKSNTMDTLSNEIQGTIQNLSPVADQLGGGNLRWVNGAAQFVGSLANDPNAQKYAYYITQLRSELAGSNAVAGGKIGLHGQVETNESHLAEAERVIKNGLDSGGARGLAQAVEASRAKNVAVVEHQTNEATRGIWNALNLGPQYEKLHKAPAPGANGAPPPPKSRFKIEQVH